MRRLNDFCGESCLFGFGSLVLVGGVLMPFSLVKLVKGIASDQKVRWNGKKR